MQSKPSYSWEEANALRMFCCLHAQRNLGQGQGRGISSSRKEHADTVYSHNCLPKSIIHSCIMLLNHRWIQLKVCKFSKL